MNAAMTTKVGSAKHLSYQTRAFMYNIAIETSKKKKKNMTQSDRHAIFLELSNKLLHIQISTIAKTSQHHTTHSGSYITCVCNITLSVVV